MNYVLRLLRRLVMEEVIVIGELSRDMSVFKPWNFPPEEALEKIRHDWESLDRPISMWEVCWVSSTPKGDAIAVTLPYITETDNEGPKRSMTKKEIETYIDA